MPKLIYTQEFSDGLLLPNNRDDTIDSLDDTDCLAPLGNKNCLSKIEPVPYMYIRESGILDKNYNSQ